MASKSAMPPKKTGLGLHARLIPRTTSAAVTGARRARVPHHAAAQGHGLLQAVVADHRQGGGQVRRRDGVVAGGRRPAVELAHRQPAHLGVRGVVAGVVVHVVDIADADHVERAATLGRSGTRVERLKAGFQLPLLVPCYCYRYRSSMSYCTRQPAWSGQQHPRPRHKRAGETVSPPCSSSVLGEDRSRRQITRASCPTRCHQHAGPVQGPPRPWPTYSCVNVARLSRARLIWEHGLSRGTQS